MKCRHCANALRLVFIDLGTAPPSNAYLTAEQLHQPEKWYPLRVLVCENCWLVQTEDYAEADELFSPDYAYFSSYSSTWLRHAETYVQEMVDRFGLDSGNHVVEIAANDGYLLQYVQQRDIPCYGVEPTAATAAAARKKGIEIVQDFFGRRLATELADEGRQADLMVANNVLAHVPDINDFVTGFATLLKPSGVATFEFPHLVELVAHHQFDTIYHEHFSYLSLTAVDRIFRANGLVVFDVQQLSTHGGSLRVFAQRRDTGRQPVTDNVAAILEMENRLGIATTAYYSGLQGQAERIKDDLLTFLLDARRDGKRVAAYGAAAKGNTLLNFAGVRRDLLPYVCDAAPSKQGKFLPGSRIPIMPPEAIAEQEPDFVLVLPWNLRDEIANVLEDQQRWSGTIVTCIPTLKLQ